MGALAHARISGVGRLTLPCATPSAPTRARSRCSEASTRPPTWRSPSALSPAPATCSTPAS